MSSKLQTSISKYGQSSPRTTPPIELSAKVLESAKASQIMINKTAEANQVSPSVWAESLVKRSPAAASKESAENQRPQRPNQSEKKKDSKPLCLTLQTKINLYDFEKLLLSELQRNLTLSQSSAVSQLLQDDVEQSKKE